MDSSPPENPARLRRRQRRRRALAIVAVSLAIAAAIFHRPLFLGNFGVVDPGLVYRSAQPKGNLDDLIREHKPASILNLRGGSRKDWWYAAEVDATEEAGIAFYDYQMSAEKRPTRRQLLTLLDLFDRAEYPLLIHCKQGADRTGLASALYLMSKKGLAPDEARSCLTIWHGHLPIHRTAHLHEPLREYTAWLSSSDLPHTPDRFRSWLEEVYEDPSDPAPSRELDPLPTGSRWNYIGRIADSSGKTGTIDATSTERR
jgi:protein tyrosine phosphatase (PTP) superfamily phosphohydrolase (DUF442 family)